MRTRRVYSLVSYARRQKDWSLRTFGPGQRTEGVLRHIAAELDEIRAAPGDLSEWIDVIILALDGAWRAGHSPIAIARALADKQAVNLARKWPDWRTKSENEPIEHVRAEEDSECDK